jgi:hypothetical protein
MNFSDLNPKGKIPLIMIYGVVALKVSAILITTAASFLKDETVEFMQSTPGSYYLSEVVIGATEGLKLTGWSNPEVEDRVSVIERRSKLLRKGMSDAVASAYDDVRETGRKQALMGEWSEAALNGYLDTIETPDSKFGLFNLDVTEDYTPPGDEDIRSDREAYWSSSTSLSNDLERNAASLISSGNYKSDVGMLKDGVNVDGMTGIPIIDVAKLMDMSPSYDLAAYLPTHVIGVSSIEEPFLSAQAIDVSLEDDSMSPN